jgi:HAD superfamily hydrolase (TIGR01484 family)
VRALSRMPAATAKSLRGIVFDLDGTLLTDGALTLEAYSALHALHSSGLRLVACTGRPASWGEVMQRQWPIDLAVTENGAICFHSVDGRVQRIDRLDEEQRQARRERLLSIVEQLGERFGDAQLADDNLSRQSDVTFDIGDVPPDRVEEIRSAAVALGAHCFQSSMHLHITLDTDDRASGTLHALARAFDEDPSAALTRYAFIGNSANDEACFSAFRTTFGVRNVVPDLPRLTVAPGYGSTREAGAGFSEIAELLLFLRESA